MRQISSIVYTRLDDTRVQAILSIIDVEKTWETFSDICDDLASEEYVNGKTDQRIDYDSLYGLKYGKRENLTHELWKFL